MKIVILIISITICASKERQTKFAQRYMRNGNKNLCIDEQQATGVFRIAFATFTANLLKKVSLQGNHYMALAPLSVWITLAAIAEGADENTQKELFTLLNLPENACSRFKLYQIAVTRSSSSKYVSVLNKRILLIDKGAHINGHWYKLVRQYSLLQMFPAPIERNPVATIEITKIFILTNHQLNFNGNSIILNSMDYDGLWTTAFNDNVAKHSPFYNQAGKRIGSVDLMKMKTIVRIGYVASINAKVLELPIGINGEYRMIFALVVDNNSSIDSMVSSFHNYTIFEAKASLQDSQIPIDVAIPRFLMKSEIDMKQILEGMGIVNLWQDPRATGFISYPPALPTTYIQRTTLTLTNEGVHPQPQLEHIPPQRYNFEERYWSEFVVDRPFMVVLVDAETYTSLMMATYSKPTYS
ncbi:unnamed protein product [Arctia plantaginis]|uniref:Serpin domain-containing protein n=1 Tax=Arctia plantaginis TaxID=874455 RepID=A0A8S0ZZV0_ARCPL|nr:unnamed protein product [Arctia plantaginis]